MYIYAYTSIGRSCTYKKKLVQKKLYSLATGYWADKISTFLKNLKYHNNFISHHYSAGILSYDKYCIKICIHEIHNNEMFRIFILHCVLLI